MIDMASAHYRCENVNFTANGLTLEPKDQRVCCFFIKTLNILIKNEAIPE